MKQTTTFETGATSHAVNDLILFADNTRGLAELRDNIYKQFTGNLEYIDFSSLCKAARKQYEKEMPDSCRHIKKMTLDERKEFCQLYVNDFENWKSEHIQPVKHGDNITIIGKRWFDKVNGNTYFSAIGLINNKEVVSIDYSYGYGEQYVYGVYKALEKAGYLEGVKHYENGSAESLWEYCERNGIIKYLSVSDVSRKKDLYPAKGLR